MLDNRGGLGYHAEELWKGKRGSSRLKRAEEGEWEAQQALSLRHRSRHRSRRLESNWKEGSGPQKSADSSRPQHVER